MKKIMILLSLLMFLPLTAISKPLIPIMKTLFTDVTGTVPDAEEIAHKAELFRQQTDAPRDKCTLSCAINGIHAAFHYLKKNYISGCVMTVPTG